MQSDRILRTPHEATFYYAKALVRQNRAPVVSPGQLQLHHALPQCNSCGHRDSDHQRCRMAGGLHQVCHGYAHPDTCAAREAACPRDTVRVRELHGAVLNACTWSQTLPSSSWPLCVLPKQCDPSCTLLITWLSPESVFS